MRLALALSYWALPIVSYLTHGVGAAVVRTKIPNKVTQRDVEICEQAAKQLVVDVRACEKNIQKLNQDSTKEIGRMVKQYANIDKQWGTIKKKEGHINKALEGQYDKEKKYLKVVNDVTDMMKPQARNFLQDGGHNALDPIVVDKWLKCDDNLKGLKQQKEGCRVKTKTVTSWNLQRRRQYLDKADVYINRVASQNEPLDAKIDELKRTSATVSRLKVQSKAVFDTAAKADFSDFYKIPDDEPGARPLASCSAGCNKAGGKVTWTQTKRVGASVMLHFEKFAKLNFLRLTNKGGSGNLKSIRLTFSDGTSTVVIVKSGGQLQKIPLPIKVTKAIELEVLSVHKHAKDVPCEISFSYEGAVGTSIYAALADRKVYKQSLKRMTPSSGWTLAAAGNVLGIAVAGDTLYGIGADQKIYKQTMSTMTPSTSWLNAGAGNVISIAIHGNTFYAVGRDQAVYSQVLNTMTPSTSWRKAGKGKVISIAISGSTVYGVGTDKTVYKQEVKDMLTGSWTAIGAGPMTSITIGGDTIYGTSADKKVHQQSLRKMSPSSKWSLAGKGSAVSVAFKEECSAGTYFHKSECLYSCPTGFYSQRGSEDKPGSCKQCTTDCGACTGAATCTQCTNSKFLHNGRCVICPSGYFGFGSGATAVCKKCEANCKKCSDATTCSVCSASVSPFLHNANCVSACPNGYFGGGSQLTGRSCQACERGCNKCTDAVSCTQCSFSKYLHNDKCLIKCPSEYVGSGSGVTGRTCEARLMPGCTVVSGPCTSAGACCQSPNHPGTYPDSQRCEMRMASITSVPVFTTEAKYDILTVGGKQYSGVAKPNTGTLSGNGLVQWTSDSSQGMTGWKICGTVKAPACSTYLHNGNQCVAKCPSGFYGLSGSGGKPGSCKQCEANCGACIDATTCTQCTNSKFLHMGNCVGLVPTGYFGSGSGPTGRSCKKCEANCKKCSDATTCLVCSNSATPFLLNGNCISSCPTGYFSPPGKIQTLGKTCQACETGCSKCTDAVTCTQCTNTMHLHQSNCTKTCPSGHFGSGSGVTGRSCEACESNCNACSTAFICTQCTNSKHLHNFDCMAACPSGFSAVGTGVTGRTCKVAIVSDSEEEEGGDWMSSKRSGRKAQLGDEEEEFLQRNIAFGDSTNWRREFGILAEE